MRHVIFRSAMFLAVLTTPPPSHAQWVKFQDETATRLTAGPEVVGDASEKDYAWGDVDNDGDVDLVIVRKEPFNTTGKRTNVLLLNEQGVLTDRTQEFASAAVVSCCGAPPDQGFKTPTNDRDVQLTDVDLDGWLDIVTATTLSDGDPKHIGHPRVYVNLGCAGACSGTEDWLGFRYEEARIPQLLSLTGAPRNPRFNVVAVGDVTGDGYPDLWFGDNDDEPVIEAPGLEFDDRLLVNQGATAPGYFVDETFLHRFSGALTQPGVGSFAFPFSESNASSSIVDLNGDGYADIVKHTADNPTYVGVAYNNPNDEGTFNSYQALYSLAGYAFTTGDLNVDGRMDLVIVDDGQDRYILNLATNPEGKITTSSYAFGYQHTGAGGPPADEGLGGNSVVADLDRDGLPDVVVADIDVEVPGCQRRTHIYRNLGSQGGPAPYVGFQEQTQGAHCQLPFSNPPDCLVADIPASDLEGTFDVAVFDIDGDSWLDLVLGRCGGTAVYINQGEGASLRFERGLYGCVEHVEVVLDGEALAGSGDVVVELSSEAEAVPELVHLTEGEPGHFTTTFPLDGTAPATPGDGRLSVHDGDVVTVSYLGLEDTTSIDCRPPVVSHVQITRPSPSVIHVEWTTDEASDTRVEYGLTPDMGVHQVETGLVTSHVTNLTSVLCPAHYLAVRSKDALGNVSTPSLHVTDSNCLPVSVVPDGTGATAPVRVEAVIASTGIWISWDNSCATDSASLIYGPLSQMADYAVTGAVCGIAESQSMVLWPWSQVPQESAWFLMIRSAIEGVEGSWGQSSSGERNGTTPSGQCGTYEKLGSACP